MARGQRTVEAALSQVQQRLGLAASRVNWVEQVSGSLADIPEEDYQQFLDYCRAVRHGDAVRDTLADNPWQAFAGIWKPDFDAFLK